MNRDKFTTNGSAAVKTTEWASIPAQRLHMAAMGNLFFGLFIASCNLHFLTF